MIKIAFVAAFVAIAGYGVYTNQKSETLSDLTLANVEALAGGESGGYYCCSPYSYECYRIVGGGIVPVLCTLPFRFCVGRAGL